MEKLSLPKADRTIILAPVIGIVAGVAAILFHLLCLAVTHYALTRTVGYEQGGPENEQEFAKVFHTTEYHADRTFSPWLLLLVPTVGGLVSGLVVFTFAPEAAGPGTDSAIDGYHNKRGFIRPRVPLVKMISSAITIGTGGSGGREGPIAQIGAGLGSYIATRLKLTDSERRVLMASGLGAGIAAIFHAPLAGAIFAIEVLYRDPDFEAEALIPAFISTTVAYCTFCLVFGFQTLFVVPDMMFNQPTLLLPLTCLAFMMAMASLGYVKCFTGVRALFAKLKIPNGLKPAVGALLTAVIALGVYFSLQPFGAEAQMDSLSVLSFGYGFLQKVLAGELPGDLTAAIVILLAIGIGKLITTSLTIGSGGSSGVFGPSMVMGGCLGALVGLIFHHIVPNWVEMHNVPMFAILGMASFFAAAANTPVSTLIMVSELTGSYKLLLPSMWVCALAYLISRNWSLYSEQVKNRMESPAHRGDFIIDVLAGLRVKDAMSQLTREYVSAPIDMALSEMASLITSTRQICFPVVDMEGKYYGLFGLNDIRQFLYDSPLAELAVAQDLAMNVEPITVQMDLSSAITLFAQSQFEELPVVDEDDPTKVIGLLRRQDMIAAYNARLLEMRRQD